MVTLGRSQPTYGTKGYRDLQEARQSPCPDCAKRKNPYAEDRFFKADATVEHYLDGRLVREHAAIYSYESHTTLFDVTITDVSGRVYFTKNMRASEYLPAHEQIMHHFKIKG
jgi:hypothetical protein